MKISAKTYNVSFYLCPFPFCIKTNQSIKINKNEIKTVLVK